MKKLFLLFFLCVPFVMQAQKVVIVKIELVKETIVVHYQLDDSNPNYDYQINLYTSADNFALPALKVQGDVGDEVKPGNNKKIEWNAAEELKGFKGVLSLEVRGKVYIPVVKLQNFNNSGSYKRGKSYDLLWKAGNTNPVNMEILKGDKRVYEEKNIPNNGKHDLKLKPNLKPGGNYQLKFTDSQNSEDVVYSRNFRVKRKTPLVVKAALPIVIFGGAVAAYLYFQDNEEKGLNDIPGPPTDLPTDK